MIVKMFQTVLDVKCCDMTARLTCDRSPARQLRMWKKRENRLRGWYLTIEHDDGDGDGDGDGGDDDDDDNTTMVVVIVVVVVMVDSTSFHVHVSGCKRRCGWESTRLKVYKKTTVRMKSLQLSCWIDIVFGL